MRGVVLPVIREALRLKLPVEVYASAGFGKKALIRYLAHEADVVDGFADGIVYLQATKQLVRKIALALSSDQQQVRLFFRESQNMTITNNSSAALTIYSLSTES